VQCVRDVPTATFQIVLTRDERSSIMEMSPSDVSLSSPRPIVTVQRRCWPSSTSDYGHQLGRPSRCTRFHLFYLFCLVRPRLQSIWSATRVRTLLIRACVPPSSGTSVCLTLAAQPADCTSDATLHDAEAAIPTAGFLACVDARLPVRNPPSVAAASQLSESIGRSDAEYVGR
jgi:hypothetical protein